MAVLLIKKSLQVLLVASCAVDFSSFAVRIADSDNANLTASEDVFGGDEICHASKGWCVWGQPEDCAWSPARGECTRRKCYYPKGSKMSLSSSDRKYGVRTNFEDGINNKVKMFQREFQQNSMCRRQMNSLQRFDGEPLSLESDWRDCIKAFYEVSSENEWCPRCRYGELKKSNISPARYTQPASYAQLQNLQRACGQVGEEFSGGQQNIVLFVANTPRKDELSSWMHSNPNARTIMQSYKLSGTATTVAQLKKDFQLPDSQFIKSRLHTESGPKGGDVQGTALMALKKVRAMFFFQSWATECHRCDIQAMVQSCLGAKSMGYKIDCALTADEADAVAATLANELRR